MRSSRIKAVCAFVSALALGRMVPMALAAVALSGFASSAPAALIATGTGTGNTTAPNSDPGFNRMGSVNGLSGVYFRNGWVLTARHVGAGPFVHQGTTYAAVPGSTVYFSNPDLTRADLIAFKLATRPALADIALTNSPAGVNTLVTVIGFGADRGPATSWMGLNGWTWSSSSSLRWGTNRISSVGLVALDTQAFQITFDDIPNPPPGQHEADIVVGDSGGGAFTGSGPSATLIGILFAHAGFVGQPDSTSFFGNAGVIVDLYAYRDDLLATVDRPDCSDDLDDDGDGLVDFPADPGCASVIDSSERSGLLVCDNGLDDDGDTLIDFPRDPGCAIGSDISERGTSVQCDNGIDDDGDLAVDFPNDSGCLHPTNKIEAPEPGISLSLAAGGLALAAARRSARRIGYVVPQAQTSSTRSTR